MSAKEPTGSDAVGLGESSRSFAYKIAEKATGRHISENVLFGYYSGGFAFYLLDMPRDINPWRGPSLPFLDIPSNRVLLRALFKVD